MAHELRIHCKDRAAATAFRNRATTVWGRPDGTAPIGLSDVNCEAQIENDQ
jgi:hypothetical protein